MLLKNPKWPCRVCGLDMGSDVWGGDDNLNCTHDICDCCGAEAGTDDFDLAAVRRYREQWIASGFRWFMPTSRPSDWNYEAQMQNIPERWI